MNYTNEAFKAEVRRRGRLRLLERKRNQKRTITCLCTLVVCLTAAAFLLPNLDWTGSFAPKEDGMSVSPGADIRDEAVEMDTPTIPDGYEPPLIADPDEAPEPNGPHMDEEEAAIRSAADAAMEEHFGLTDLSLYTVEITHNEDQTIGVAYMKEGQSEAYRILLNPDLTLLSATTFNRGE